MSESMNLREKVARRLFNVAVNITNSGVWIHNNGLNDNLKSFFYYEQADYLLSDVIEEIKGTKIPLPHALIASVSSYRTGAKAKEQAIIDRLEGVQP